MVFFQEFLSGPAHLNHPFFFHSSSKTGCSKTKQDFSNWNWRQQVKEGHVASSRIHSASPPRFAFWRP